MKKRFLLANLIIIIVVCMQGCVVVVEEGQLPQEPLRKKLSSNETVIEIDAIGKLAFDNSRRDGFKRIAQREGLHPEAQVHLIRAAFQKLAFENSRKEILLTLINNPSFCSDAKIEILENLNKMAFDNSKEEILKAINDVKITDENPS